MSDFFTRTLSDDPMIEAALGAELHRQDEGIELIASENIVSPAVLQAQGSVLTNKYAEGYPGPPLLRRLRADGRGGAGGDRPRHRLVRLRPRERAAAFRCTGQHRGDAGAAQARRHLSRHGDRRRRSPHPRRQADRVGRSGSTRCSTACGARTACWTTTRSRDLAREHCPKLIIAGGSAIPRQIDFARFRAIADEVGALLMVDMAHFAGLVAGGRASEPVPARPRRHHHHPQDPARARAAA